jgi:cell wall-associated NlpC family hydrolase
LYKLNEPKGGRYMIKKVFVLTFCFLFVFQTAVSAQHYVKSGDTLWEISKQYNMFYSRLLEMNPQIENPNHIYIGQKINVADTSKAKQIVEYAESLQPVTTYVYGAEDFSGKPYKADCSSWTQHIYEKFGVNLPRVSWEQSRTGTPVTFKELQIGDLMFFGENGKVSHVGIYMGGDQWISNLGTGKDVKIFSIYGSWSYNSFLWGTRVL